MKINNSFWVSRPPEQTWRVLNDIELIAPSLPGAELLEFRPDGSYVGRVNISLGPIALSFKGSVAYEARDDMAMTATVKADGNEERARGVARAVVNFAARPEKDGTRVAIDTELKLAGSIAQYARGVSLIETTAQILIDDFAENLEALLGEDKLQPQPNSTSFSSEPVAQPVDAKAPPSTRTREILGFRLLWRLLVRWFSLRRAGRS